MVRTQKRPQSALIAAGRNQHRHEPSLIQQMIDMPVRPSFAPLMAIEAGTQTAGTAGAAAIGVAASREHRVAEPPDRNADIGVKVDPQDVCAWRRRQILPPEAGHDGLAYSAAVARADCSGMS